MRLSINFTAPAFRIIHFINEHFYCTFNISDIFAVSLASSSLLTASYASYASYDINILNVTLLSIQNPDTFELLIFVRERKFNKHLSRYLFERFAQFLHVTRWCSSTFNAS